MEVRRRTRMVKALSDVPSYMHMKPLFAEQNQTERTIA